MGLNDALLKQLNSMGRLPKKQKMLENTPLQHFIRPLMEEDMKRRMMELQQMGGMQQMPQLGTQSSGMVEPPSVNPLENALMSVGQGGGMSSPQGGMPNGAR